MRAAVMVLLGLLAGCGADRPPPANRSFEGLPVTGDRAFAEGLGFGRCVKTATALRCFKDGVVLEGEGPYQSAVDLGGRGGREGFNQLTLWDDHDQRAVYAVGAALKAAGWQQCRTGTEDRGDQEIWTKDGARIRFSIDISYWGKRRVRLLPETGEPIGKCW